MPDARHPGWPLSAAQYGIWLGQQLDPASPAYNTAGCVEIAGPVDPSLFQRAVRRAMEETDAVHMLFVQDADGPRQIRQGVDWVMPMVDVGGAPDPEAAAMAWMRRDLETIVRLDRDPLFGQALFKAADDRWFWYQRIHHVAMDGFGYSLLARRVADLYSALAANRPEPAAAIAPFRAVVDEDLAYRSSPAFDHDRDFWLDRSTGWPEPVSFSERRSPIARGFIRETGSLPASVLERLTAVAANAGAGWPDVVTAAVAAFLHGRTGATDIVLGSPVMGRLGSASLRVPCMAMNIVPLRLRLEPGFSLSGLTRQVAEELRLIRPHQRYRHEQIRRDWKMLNGQRRLFGPVVNIMPFDYHLRFDGHPGTAHNISAGPVEDLSIGVYSRSDGTGPRIDFDANPACYDAVELADLRREFIDFLTNSIRSSDRPAEVARLAPRTPILDGGPLPGAARAVLDMITEQARLRPEALAVVQDGTELTYGQLVRAAADLAGRLAEQGAGPGQLIAIRMPRGPDWVVAILGVMLVGAAYLPLNPEGPEARDAAILKDAAPTLLIGPELAITALDAGFGPILPAESLAYVIYTSGSTGLPNGVMISRRALDHFVAGATARYGITRDDRVLQFAPLHFDASVEEILLTLCAGAVLVLRTDAMIGSLPRFVDAVARHGVTVLDLPTAYWNELTHAVASGAAPLPPSVRLVIIGGEAALAEPVRRWREAVGSAVTLLNTYGPTEATVVATVATLAGSGAPPPGEDIPIGLPLPGMWATVLDGDERPVRRGGVGELHLVGGALAEGYLGRPERTDERFVTLGGALGTTRAYRTGDLVRLGGDGRLVFVGRVDDEFKISGHRVAPQEIEAALLACPGIREAAVVGHILPGGARRLSAHVVADQPPPALETLRHHLRQALPASVIPAGFVFTNRLPRNANGKIDRSALREAPGINAEDASPPALTPPVMTKMERIVGEVWRDVLGHADIGSSDDFFELGGQSLQAIQAANRLSVRIGRDVPVAALFQHSTVAALAGFLDTGPPEATRPTLFCVHPAGGMAWCYLAMAKLLPDQPIHGIQARGLEADEPPPTSLEALALDYVAEIRRLQPTGAYHLLGWSAGGVIAHAMAVQLQADGQEVALLAMLDAYPSEQWSHLGPPGERDALAALLNVAGHDRTALRDAALDRAGALTLLRAEGGPLASLDAERLDRLITVTSTMINLLRGARHGRFRGDPLFFTAAVPRPETWLSWRAWQPHVDGRIDNVDLDCAHPAMLKPAPLAEICRHLAARIERRPLPGKSFQ
ncbi:thioester reductase [Skermanella stibiiresistens SB22]|uniref:Thioester reductase n=1 Tax=Skermanella stibiiresistens SB22 TaxID=1385369 RepID=W9H4D8_9PROT|nr:non-ribosomal peptide synthetase [Skermanella stibiiresistens]EWY39631.1 thioester reductase [Skermanella stibiiresistens SB22]